MSAKPRALINLAALMYGDFGDVWIALLWYATAPFVIFRPVVRVWKAIQG